MSAPSPRHFAGLRIVSHDANKTTYEVWPKPKPTKKKKKARPRIPKGPLVAAALAAADDAGTRHHVQDIHFAYKHYTQTARLVRFLHHHLDAVFIRVRSNWRTSATTTRSKGGEYWRVGFRFPLSSDKLRRVLHANPKKGFPKVKVRPTTARPPQGDMNEADNAELRRHGNYAPLFSFTDEPFRTLPCLTLSPCCNGCNGFKGPCTKVPWWNWKRAAGLPPLPPDPEDDDGQIGP